MQAKAFEGIFLENENWHCYRSNGRQIMKLGVTFVLMRRPIVDTPQRLQIMVCTTARSGVVPSSLDFFIKFVAFFLGQMNVLL